MIPTSTDVTVAVKPTIPADVDAVAVLVHKREKKAEGKLSPAAGEFAEAINSLFDLGVITGKSNETSVQLFGQGKKARKLIVVGLGDATKFSIECLREAGGTLAKLAKKQKVKSLAIVLPELPASLPGTPNAAVSRTGQDVAPEAVANGFLLGSFKYTEYKGTAQSADELPKIRLTLVVEDEASAKPAVQRGIALAEGQNFARTIASRPGNDINPPSLAKVAQELAKEVGLGIRVLDEREMAKLGMGGILAVGAGSSATPPRMIVLDHSPSGGKKSAAKTLLVVGKAITFDTGGISIKPAEKMQRMIFDKCGGMAVLGLMYVAAKLKLPIRIVGILASAENHISETAYRPGDILHMYNGVTVEVTNTDAEGRLVLGDALSWGIETYKPSAVVNLATLTGGVIVALGRGRAGIMSNNDGLVEELQQASQLAGEKLWRLPLEEEDREYIKSDPADIVNSGGRDGHPLQGGAFLSYFVPKDGSVPWAHLDIAGVADTEKELPFYVKGSTGWGVRTLVEWVNNVAGGTGTVKHASPLPAGG